MKAIEIRNKYLNFFKNHGHVVIPSAPLIPENDPSVLFTTAGMQPLVPYLLGEKHPEGTRLTDFQKCLRTNDIDEVGDNRHLTYFEMLGNWSLGDYFKEESIAMSFEFLTKELGIPVEKLSVTCFAGDEDCQRDEVTASCWRKAGIPEERIYYFGKDDNWWIAGETGPCGPDTEMFYDTYGMDSVYYGIRLDDFMGEEHKMLAISDNLKLLKKEGYDIVSSIEEGMEQLQGESYNGSRY